MPARRARILVAILVAAMLAARDGGAAKPPACPGGRFLVTGPSILSGDAVHDVEAIVIADRQVAIGDACAPARARVKRTKRGTAVRAAWKQCGGFDGRVRLAATIGAPGCTTLSGTFTIRKAKVKRAFTAVLSECGDGTMDVGAGEACEPPATTTCDAGCQTIVAPAITIDAPENFALTSAPTIRVSGTVSATVVDVACNGVATLPVSGAFSAVMPLTQGHNTIVCVGTTADAGMATASVSVTRDATGPRVGITTPKPSAILTASPVTVAGVVNDLVAGDRTTAEPTVVCNGVGATVANRTFAATGIPLDVGPGVITCTATDAAGNETAATVDVSLVSPAGPAIQAVSGDGQMGPIARPLAAPLVVALDNGAGQPVAGKTIIFRVIENDGTLAGGSGSPRAVMVPTGADGQAAATFTLGTRVGIGNQQVRATAVGFAGEVVFSASATAGAPARIVADAGALQTGLVGTPLSLPFVATVVDAGNNRLAGVPVTFTVEAGGGSIAEPTAVTDLDGRAHAFLTLGPTPDRDGQIVAATFAGNTGSPARFVASARAGGDPAATRISGVVLDGSNLPMPNVLVGIGDTTISTMTDGEGQFTIAPAPVGRVDLWVVGSTTTRAGVWPSLPYELVTVPGEDNGIGKPIYLVPLDVAHGLQVDEAHGGTIAPPDLPGFALTIAPGSATFPDGTRSGVVTVTAVHPDKVPMVPQFGQQPRMIVTIQPAGTLFDPPASLTIPNTDGLPPGQKTEMFSFDHDLRSFVTIGTGTVSEDGSVIRSDPGVGVVKAGWHCGGNPAGTGTCEHECDDGESCTTDTWAGGRCQTTPKPDGTLCDPAPDTLECGGGGIRVLCVTGLPTCQSGKCTAPKPNGGPNKREVYKALNALCQSISLPDGGCSGSVGQAMKEALRGQRLQVVCTPNSGCRTTDDCACAPQNAAGSVFVGQSAGNPAECGDLAKLLRHELQHRLLGRFHAPVSGVIDCATDPVYGCDAACGHLNCCTASDAACDGFVNQADPGTCRP